jgi:hypothetical protein
MENLALAKLSLDSKFLSEADAAVPVYSQDAIEVAPHDGVSSISRWRRCRAQKDVSTQLWVNFSTLRFLNGGECTLVVLFRRKDTVSQMTAF